MLQASHVTTNHNFHDHDLHAVHMHGLRQVWWTGLPQQGTLMSVTSHVDMHMPGLNAATGDTDLGPICRLVDLGLVSRHHSHATLPVSGLASCNPTWHVMHSM